MATHGGEEVGAWGRNNIGILDQWLCLPFFLMEEMDSKQTGQRMLERKGLEGGAVEQEGVTKASLEVAMGDMVRSIVGTLEYLGCGGSGKLASTPLWFSLSTK